MAAVDLAFGATSICKAVRAWQRVRLSQRHSGDKYVANTYAEHDKLVDSFPEDFEEC